MDTPTNILEIFEAQKQQAIQLRTSGYAARVEKLNRLEKTLLQFRPAIYQALRVDLNKSEMEADLSELMPVFKEIRFAKRNLRNWISPFAVPAPLSLIGTRSYYQYEPKGVCLLISPWNYPVNLTLGPLVAALAAGNTVMIKPSERCPATAEVLRQMIESAFPASEVKLLLGDGALGSQLLDLPFHHIFFTGSTATGKKIMEKASRHLASITLELGGKSPTIIDETADLPKAAHRIAWSKMINSGQTCIAPDYILVQESVKESFIRLLKNEVDSYFKLEPASVCKLIDENHYKKMEGFLEDLDPGVQRIPLTDTPLTGQFVPCLLIDPPSSSAIMQEEIFGPLLPLIPFRTLEEAIGQVQERPKPLSLYIYSSNRKNIRKLLQETSSGGAVVNMGLLHYINPHLPFGGVNASGIGKGHGFFGFQAFSNQKSVLHQVLPFGAAEIFRPPFSQWKKRLLKFMIKYI